MTTRAAGRAAVKQNERLTEERDHERQENAQLLDILNAILYAQGGKIVVSNKQLVAADRRKIHVTRGQDAIVIETEKRSEEEQVRPITEKLWLPGQEPA